MEMARLICMKFYCSEPYRKLFFVDDVISERYRVHNFRDWRQKIVNTYLDYHFSSTKSIEARLVLKIERKNSVVILRGFLLLSLF